MFQDGRRNPCQEGRARNVSRAHSVRLRGHRSRLPAPTPRACAVHRVWRSQHCSSQRDLCFIERLGVHHRSGPWRFVETPGEAGHGCCYGGPHLWLCLHPAVCSLITSCTLILMIFSLQIGYRARSQRIVLVRSSGEGTCRPSEGDHERSK